MGVMDDPVAYGVRKGRVSYDVVPRVNGELARNDSGAPSVSVFHDLKDVPPFPVCKGVYSPVINNEQSHPLDPFEELAVTPIRPRDHQFLGQPGQPHVKGTYPLPYGAIS